MGVVRSSIKQEKEILLVYMQRMVPGRPFEHIGNLGILTLASRLKQLGYNARCITGISSDIKTHILKNSDKLFAVCFYCDFDNMSVIKSIIKVFSGSSFYMLVGGPQTMHMTQDDAVSFGSDAILCGDGEESLPAWLDSHFEGKKGLLDEELTPDKEGLYTLLYDFSNYSFAEDSNSLDKKKSLFSVITARGCPHRCSFCFEGGSSKTLRPRPVKEVLEEVETRLCKAPYLKYLFFADDTFTYNIDRLKEFIFGLKNLRKKYDFVWFCEGHASFFRKYPDSLKEMVDSGLVRMQIGLESGCNEILEAYSKGITTDDIRYTARLAWEAHLPQLAGNFIIGGALENIQTLAKTRSFMLSLMDEFPGLLDISTTFPIPLPGTSLLNNPTKYCVCWDYPEYDVSIEDVPVNHTAFLSSEEIARGRQQFLSEMLSKMRTLYENNKIDRAIIRKNYELWIKYGITDTWGKEIFRCDKNLNSYYIPLITKDLHEWSELSEKCKKDAFIVGVNMFSKYSELADGKTVSHFQRDNNKTAEEVNAFMQKAEEEYLLLFAALV